ncbi:hypothetical protein DYB38_008925 [Aphanomyces astaci]|uniref:Uncharacterized protein n=1 Tax=Aphanomyces astaci TaxID=112090 RepID=A0A397BYA1_APHAT|nr:hypothetical protein DYB38_008925 [Aphanomyces astaci]RHY63122.1 hypothetical protein DYB34_009872 [Aphanomyces astaci]
MQSLDDDYDDFFNPALFLNEKFVAANRALFQDKVVLELGAGAGLAGFVASQFASRTAITDGNDVVLRLLDQNADQASSPCGVFKLLWGEEDSVVQFQKDFPHPIDVLLGADVVCWPNLVLPLLRTIKDLFFAQAKGMGFKLWSVPHGDFLPTPRPVNVTSTYALIPLSVFILPFISKPR